eukprot:5684994-Prymnesium_polylepis.1
MGSGSGRLRSSRLRVSFAWRRPTCASALRSGLAARPDRLSYGLGSHSQASIERPMLVIGCVPPARVVGEWVGAPSRITT